jgi:hypothetical protein
MTLKSLVISTVFLETCTTTFMFKSCKILSSWINNYLLLLGPRPQIDLGLQEGDHLNEILKGLGVMGNKVLQDSHSSALC